jgi:hypothetical protein
MQRHTWSRLTTAMIGSLFTAACGGEEEEHRTALTVEEAKAIAEGRFDGMQQGAICTTCEPPPDPEPTPVFDPNNLKSGDVVRNSANGAVYKMYGSNLVYMPTWESLTALGISSSSIHDITSAQMEKYASRMKYATNLPGEEPRSTPASWVFPPDNAGQRYALTGLPASVQYTVQAYRPGLDVPHFKTIAMTELRGWYFDNDNLACNTDEPWGADRTTSFIVDSAWAQEHGIDLHKLVKVGNILAYNKSASYRRAWSELEIKVETNGIASGPNADTRWFRPADWTAWLTNCTKKDANDIGYPIRWQHEPRAFIPWGNYARMTGSLLIDDAHDASGFFAGIEDARNTSRIWSGTEWYTKNTNINNPARHVEMHPPDRREQVSEGFNTSGRRAVAVAVAADHGAFVGEYSEFSWLYPPPPRPTNRAVTQLVVEEIVGPETLYRSIRNGNSTNTGAAIRFLPDPYNPTYVNITVGVQGEGGWGAPGKFKAIYIMKWI